MSEEKKQIYIKQELIDKPINELFREKGTFYDVIKDLTNNDIEIIQNIVENKSNDFTKMKDIFERMSNIISLSSTESRKEIQSIIQN